MAKDNLTLARARILASGNASTAKQYGGVVKAEGGSQFEPGDVITIPKLEFKNGVLSIKATDEDAIIRQPMLDKEGKQRTYTRSDGTVEDMFLRFILVEVKRGNENIVERFYPSLLNKRFTVAVQKHGKWQSAKKLVYTTGTVIDECRQFVSMDEALEAISNRPFVFQKVTSKKVPFENRNDEVFTAEDDFVAVLNFVTEDE